MMGVTNESWIRWGLWVDGALSGRARDAAFRAHNLVSDYLEKHSEVATKYRVDQTGEVKYLDVLRLAEAAVSPGGRT